MDVGFLLSQGSGSDCFLSVVIVDGGKDPWVTSDL